MKHIQVEERPAVKLQDGPQQGDYLNFEGLCPSPGKPQKGIILVFSVVITGTVKSIKGPSLLFEVRILTNFQNVTHRRLVRISTTVYFARIQSFVISSICPISGPMPRQVDKKSVHVGFTVFLHML